MGQQAGQMQYAQAAPQAMQQPGEYAPAMQQLSSDQGMGAPAFSGGAPAMPMGQAVPMAQQAMPVAQAAPMHGQPDSKQPFISFGDSGAPAM